MNNKAMERELDAGECLDVRKVGKEVSPGKFELTDFVDGVNYADALTETWIWSIGKSYDDETIIASYGTEYYQNDKYECLFLR